MSRNRIASILVAAVWLWDAPTTRAGGDESPKTQEAAPSAAPGKLVVTVGKSLIIDSPMKIQRISVANGDLIEAVAVNPKEVLINGKAAGETSLIIWQEGGNRLLYDLTVRLSPMRLDAVRQQLARDFPNEDINVTYENETAFVRGTVKDVIAAERVMAMTASLGKTRQPAAGGSSSGGGADPVESAFLQRGSRRQHGAGRQFRFGRIQPDHRNRHRTVLRTRARQRAEWSASPKRSVFCCSAETSTWPRPSKRWKASACWKPWPSRTSWRSTARRPASWPAANFRFRWFSPAPMEIWSRYRFREFGIRIHFLPHITPRGTIQLQVAPEVSSLDYSNAVTIVGTTIPALSTRRVQTEVELESGQSFVIAGLMDNRMTETISKIPGLASIPLLGKLFTSQAISRNNSELMVIVTPEVVRPIPAGQPLALVEHARTLHDEEQQHRDASAGYRQDRTGTGEAAIGHACLSNN